MSRLPLAVKTVAMLAITTALALPSLCRAAGAAPDAGCTLLAGGAPMPALAARDAEGWNRLNFSFFDAVLTAMSAQGRTEQAFFAVDAPDPGHIAQALHTQAARAGCTRLMAVRVFNAASDPNNEELVFSVRVSPVRPSEKSTGSGEQAGPGPVVYQREYRYKATPESLARVVPSRIGEQAVQDYLRRLHP